MAIRYSDMGLDAIGARDFVARERSPTTTQIGLIIFSAFLIGFSIVSSINNKLMLITTLFALFAIIGWYVIFQLMRSRDMLLATEFQNALFAAAMGLHNKFCIIIKNNGTVVYLDRSFQGLFPDFVNQPHRSVDSLLKVGRVAESDCDRVTRAIEKGTYEKVIFDITDAHGLLHRVILSVEPILRPAGFIMLRGREFIESRAEQAAGLSNGPVINKSSVTLFSHVMESMKMGVYITSPTGNIVYCNPLLEQWLMYGEGETMARNLNITNLIPPARNPSMVAEAANIEGVVQLEKKVGGFIKAFLNQKVIYNDSGQVMGCTALVHLYHENNDQNAYNAGF